MNIEDHVTSLEFSKELKEIGVRQDSLFYWNIYLDHKKECPEVSWELSFGKMHDLSISAFTISEILEFLPAKITTYPNSSFGTFVLTLKKSPIKSIQYVVNYECGTNHFPILEGLFNGNLCNENLGNVLAATFISLANDKLIEIPT